MDGFDFVGEILWWCSGFINNAGGDSFAKWDEDDLSRCKFIGRAVSQQTLRWVGSLTENFGGDDLVIHWNYFSISEEMRYLL